MFCGGLGSTEVYNMSDSATILVTGDTHLGGGRVTKLAIERDTEALFGDFLPLIKGCDLSVTNLESPVVDDGSPIKKTGPNLKSPTGALPILQEAGFGLVTLANNHIMDYGEGGLKSTLVCSSEAGLKTVGAGEDLERASEPFTTELKGITLSVVNLAENEFGTSQNGEPGCHPMDPVQNFYRINEAKAVSDFVIVIVHGGHEYYELPSPRMKKTYRFYVDAGADAVVGHHTHCISGHERYSGAPIIYSLGNYLFDSYTVNSSLTSWNRGMMVKFSVEKGEEVQFELHPYVQGAEKPGLRTLTGKELTNFEKEIRRMNEIIENDSALEKEFNNYCKRTRRLYSSFIEPHSVGILHALRNRGFLPSLLTSRKKRLLCNLVRCEAHRDVLIKTLTS